MITFNSKSNRNCSSNNNTFISVCLPFINDKDIFVIPVSVHTGVGVCVGVCVCVGVGVEVVLGG